MMRRWIMPAFGLALALGSLSACGSGSSASGDSGSSGGKSITIGLVASQSGPTAVQGVAFARGAQLAATTINAAGGIKALGGATLNLKLKDDTGDPQAARQALSDFASDDSTVAIAGPYGSGVCLGAAPVAEQAKIPMVCSGTDDGLTKQGYKYLFNMSPFGSNYVRGTFEYLKTARPDVTSVAVLYEDGPYGTNIDKQAKTIAPAEGFKLGTELSFKTGDTNLSPLVTRAASSGAGAILVGGFTPDVINVLNAVQTTGNAGKIQVVGLTGNAVTNKVEALGKAAEGVVGITNWTDDLANRPDLKPYIDAYTKKFGEAPTADSAVGWEVVQTLAAALESAKSTDREKVHEALRSVSTEIGIMPPAPVHFDATGALADQGNMIVAAQVQNGKFVTVWPQKVAVASPEK
jgi:branched-chain amino acid transport system substrate-binding protein